MHKFIILSADIAMLKQIFIIRITNIQKRMRYSPGKRCMRTLTNLSTELKTKLQRQTINAHASGPCIQIKWGQIIKKVKYHQDGIQIKLGLFGYLCK